MSSVVRVFDVDSDESGWNFSPSFPAVLSRGAAVSQVLAACALHPVANGEPSTCVGPRWLRGLRNRVWPHLFPNRRAVLPGALGIPDKTAHVGAAARIKHKAGDRRCYGKSPALL